MNHLQNAQIGDVFAYYLERYGVYCPCQVLFENEDSVAMVFFNHFSAEVPSLDIVQQSSILLKNHHSWNGDKFAFCVERDENVQFHFIEHSDIIMSVDKQDVQENSDFSQIDFQYAWQQLPQFIQDNYHAKDPKKLKEFEGLPEYLRLDLSTIRRSRIILKEKKSLAQLQAIKQENIFSDKIESEFFDDNLQQLLIEHPLVTDLTIFNHTPKVVDISKTAIHRLNINISGVEKIILNRTINQLFLEGDFSCLKEIICPFDGRLLELYLDTEQHFSAFSGLKKVKFLRVDFVQCFDIAELAKVVTDTPTLWIMSKGGTLKNILHLKSFNKVRYLWLSNVFGFDEFPNKNDFKDLRYLMLWSIPKDIGNKIKKEFKGMNGLEIRQLRSEEWIKANLENPLKNWDGRDGNSPTKAKKAMKAYADAYKKLSKDTPNQDEQLAILQEFLQVFQAIDKKWHLDTLEREEVYSAYKMLVALTNIEQKSVEIVFEEIMC